jgi:hypothetical protein
MAQKFSRRSLLRKVAAGLPAVAAGGILAHTGLANAKGRKASDSYQTPLSGVAKATPTGAAPVRAIPSESVDT